ncbi:tetratricopeptide repeat protein [Oscillatoria sp. FACHB-1407]|uniref:tetratricopeptide repeat protein n=1 Tax=Oscillatoria sp. FACHB-1407 TaxID=2692847 RepID=UPI0016845BE5|nr:tetratricopeptide repeat protein [Oscillatoria sp. FACHB-1407]MBD2461428.1 tetratricopeptide repeat protein [Oscillatoria sp. FACHB-1407]
MLRWLFPPLLTLLLVATPACSTTPNVDDLYQQGNAAQAAGNYNEAERIFRSILERDPNAVPAYIYLANALQAQGRRVEAADQILLALQLDPNAVDTYVPPDSPLRANPEAEQAELIASLRRAVEVYPDQAASYMRLAMALADQGELPEAIANFRRAIELSPEQPFLYVRLGQALVEQGNLTEAIAAYQQAIELDPDYIEAQNRLTEAQRLLELRQ